MAAGLQIYDVDGMLLFDSNVNTLVTLIRNSRRTFIRESGLVFKTALSDIASPNMSRYFIKVWDSQSVWGVESSYINNSGELVIKLNYAPPSATSAVLDVKIYRC